MTTTSQQSARALMLRSTMMTYEEHRFILDRERRGKDILVWICFALFVICLFQSAVLVYG
jgi:hypothetical protein